MNDALDLEPFERASFIERACAGDPRLQAEVESLLSLEERFPDLLRLQASLPEGVERERIGPYPIVRVLGRGGMGIVYLAEDPRLGRQIALKVLPERLSWDPMRRALFEREARLLAALNHPNIATIYSLEEADGLAFLTMEHVPGMTLAERLSRGRMGFDEALRITRQVARALEAAHASGVIHRDLKPLNIMVTPREQVKVLDFGLATSVPFDRDGAAEVRDGAPDPVGGTPGYVSPEQLRGGAVDRRTDIWAFGCILYECLAGRSAVEGETPAEMIRATLRGNLILDALPEEIPPALRGTLAQCLERSPKRRVRRIRTVRREIDHALAVRLPPRRGLRERAEHGVPPNNLPRALAGLIGRGREREQLARHLREKREVTLIGAGGCGKTRLALETAHDLARAFPGGVWLAELAPLTDASLVPQTVAAAVGLRERPDQSITESIAGRFAADEALLILDNCEHLIPACRALAVGLLRACANLRILATSREPLRIEGEVVYRVPSLPIPGPEDRRSPDRIARADAVRLFIERARAVQPDFPLTRENAPAVAEICARLDGIPLAIELAAARVGVLPVEEIARRLDGRFRLLTGGSETLLPRQRTLRALIDWSYGLLTELERKLFRRLSVFAGSWTLEAAESVCAGDGVEGWEILDLISQLLDKSLVEFDALSAAATQQPRYRMAETIRQYARERLLGSREYARIVRRHRDHYLAVTEAAVPRLFGPDQALWLRRFQADHDNVRLAQASCTATGTAPAIRLATAMGPFWMAQGHWTEGRAIYAALLARSTGMRDLRRRALVLHWSANLAECQQDLATARAQNEEALAIRRGLGEMDDVARSLNNLGNVSHRQGDLGRARALYEESLAIQRELGNRLDIAHTLNNLGAIAGAQGKLADARTFFEESLVLKRVVGDRSAMARSLSNLGTLAAMQEDWDSARRFFDESLAVHRELEDPAGAAAVLGNLGELAMRLGDPATASARHREQLRILWRLGNRPGAGDALRSIAAALFAAKDAAAAARWLGVAEGLREDPDRSGAGEPDEELEALARSVRGQLGEAAYAFERDRGKGMDPGAAVDPALEGSGSSGPERPGSGIGSERIRRKSE